MNNINKLQYLIIWKKLLKFQELTVVLAITSTDSQFQRFDKNDVDKSTSTILQYLDVFFEHFDDNNQNKEMSTGRNSQQNKSSITKDYQ